MITVVGSYNRDMYLWVERLPQVGETVQVRRVEYYHGGKGSNQAVAATRMGGSVRIVSSVGRDREGEGALNLWKSENIITRDVKIKDSETGKAIITVDTSGNNRVYVIPGANSLLEPQDIPGDIGSSDVVLTQLEIPLDTVYRALEAEGIRILNPAPVLKGLERVLDRVDILAPNLSEFIAITGTSDIHYGTTLLLKKVREAVVITAGEEGAYLATKRGVRKFRAPKVDPVDSTGAGDVFSGALSYFIETHTIEEAVEEAILAASLSVTMKGPLGPTRDEVLKFKQRLGIL